MDGEILAESANKVAQTHDPTAHAEILAIRRACRKLGTDEFAKPWDQRRLPMRHDPREAAPDLYRDWRERNGRSRAAQ